MKKKYQDLVIKNGKFVGKFEELYQKFDDPWNLVALDKRGLNFYYEIILSYCELAKKNEKKRNMVCLEIGCGYPLLSNHLSKKKFKVYGTDISETVIKKSKKRYQKIKNNLFVSDFINFELYERINPDIIILSEVSWYVLPKLKTFLNWFKKLNRKTYIVHNLTFYKKNRQSYGNEYFSDSKSLKSFFGLKYIASTELKSFTGDKHLVFLSKNH